MDLFPIVNWLKSNKELRNQFDGMFAQFGVPNPIPGSGPPRQCNFPYFSARTCG